MNDLEERKAKVFEESQALLDLYSKEVERITAELKRSGELGRGLDANSQAYVQVNREFDQKFIELFAKYDIPPGTKLKLFD